MGCTTGLAAGSVTKSLVDKPGSVLIATLAVQRAAGHSRAGRLQRGGHQEEGMTMQAPAALAPMMCFDSLQAKMPAPPPLPCDHVLAGVL